VVVVLALIAHHHHRDVRLVLNLEQRDVA